MNNRILLAVNDSGFGFQHGVNLRQNVFVIEISYGMSFVAAYRTIELADGLEGTMIKTLVFVCESTFERFLYILDAAMITLIV